MAYRLPPLTSLRAFEAAARHLSFKAAAEELNVTPGAVSQQIKALEDYLGKPLFRRLSRAIALTPDAEAMLPKLREGFENIALAIEATHTRDTAQEELFVSAPPSFASRWLVPRLARFSALHPQTDLRLSTTMDTIDVRQTAAQLQGEVLDPRDAPNALSIRYGSGDYPGQRVSLLFASDYIAACSPKLMRGKHRLRTPDDIRHHALIHDDTILPDEERLLWLKWLRQAGVEGLEPDRGPRFGNAALAVEAATDGLGVVLALKPLLNDAVKAGRLVLPFDIAVPSRHAYYLVAPEAIADRDVVRAFADWLQVEVAAG